MRTAISICAFLLVCAACRQTVSGTAGIAAYVEAEENGLRKVAQAGKWLYTIQYRPAGYILVQEGFATDTAGRAARQEQLKGMAWFNITFRVADYTQSPLRYEVAGMEDYNLRLHYFLNEAPQDIYLMYGRDTLYPAAYGFDNSHNLTPHETMVIGFALPEHEERPTRDMQLVLYDRVFGNGIIKATIRKQHLDQIPSFGPDAI